MNASFFLDVDHSLPLVAASSFPLPGLPTPHTARGHGLGLGHPDQVLVGGGQGLEAQDHNQVLARVRHEKTEAGQHQVAVGRGLVVEALGFVVGICGIVRRGTCVGTFIDLYIP